MPARKVKKGGQSFSGWYKWGKIISDSRQRPALRALKFMDEVIRARFIRGVGRVAYDGSLENCWRLITARGFKSCTPRHQRFAMALNVEIPLSAISTDARRNLLLGLRWLPLSLVMRAKEAYSLWGVGLQRLRPSASWFDSGCPTLTPSERLGWRNADTTAERRSTLKLFQRVRQRVLIPGIASCLCRCGQVGKTEPRRGLYIFRGSITSSNLVICAIGDFAIVSDLAMRCYKHRAASCPF